ncbi:MAG: prepilin-type N-terminal cleavage/methylation domain-containing protein [Actinobacteria bacterium]|nr:prepilin-type N-terminal cleavage/methylation domain-containing protein [Actinomycetota bacterium]
MLNLKKRANEDGFTLVEIMVVILIIAILIAIAIPVFLGSRLSALDRATQSNLRNSMTVGKIIYTDNGDYSTITVAELGELEPSMDFQSAASSGGKEISFDRVSDTVVVYAALSDSEECWYLRDRVGNSAITTGTQFSSRGQGVAGACQASNTVGLAWADGW